MRPSSRSSRSGAAASTAHDDSDCLPSAVASQPTLGPVRQRPAGMDDALNTLAFGLLRPLLGQGLFKTLRAPSGALLHGPPGTGKTMLALHCLTAHKVKYVYLKASDIHSKYTGESERIIAEAFQQARSVAPAVLLIDELDCVFPARSSEAGSKHPSILSQLLVELDNVRDERVALLATTNCPDDLDVALLRRLPLRIAVPLPGHAARRSVLEMWIHEKVKKHHRLKDDHLNTLARLTEGDLANMVDEAIFRLARKISTAIMPKGVRRPSKLPPLTIRHFKIPDSSTSRQRLFTTRGRSKSKFRVNA